MIKQEAHIADDFRLQMNFQSALFFVVLVSDHCLSFSNCFHSDTHRIYVLPKT
jgi:hypothetical protein